MDIEPDLKFTSKDGAMQSACRESIKAVKICVGAALPGQFQVAVIECMHFFSWHGSVSTELGELKFVVIAYVVSD